MKNITTSIKELRQEIKRLLPNMKTIQETFKDDIAFIQQICRENDCTKDEYVLTKEEAKYIQIKIPYFKVLALKMNQEEIEIME